MKILAIGDFHGKFPKKFEKIIKKEKIDLVVSVGDYSPFSLKKEFFKDIYLNKDKNVWDYIGKKKYKEKIRSDYKKGEEVFKKLSKLSVPVFTVLGNHDYPSDDMWDENFKSSWSWDNKEIYFISKALKKYPHIKRIDYSYAKIKDYIFIGMRGHSNVGKIQSKAYKRYRAKLDKLFKKFSEENKQGKIIFVSHNSPYNTKLDLITAKDAHKRAKNKHFGSKMFRRLIDKYQPVLSISGHIEEGKGKQKLGKTIAVNCGSIHHGEGAIIELDKGKVKKVKFVK